MEVKYILSCVENHRDRFYCILGCFSTEALAQEAQKAHEKGRVRNGIPFFHYRIDRCEVNPSMDDVIHLEP